MRMTVKEDELGVLANKPTFGWDRRHRLNFLRFNEYDE
jgi:penicillin V acylase-like amidase (Ntn superfamily)